MPRLEDKQEMEYSTAIYSNKMLNRIKFCANLGIANILFFVYAICLYLSHFSLTVKATGLKSGDGEL